jgi:hypothetical protein
MINLFWLEKLAIFNEMMTTIKKNNSNHNEDIEGLSAAITDKGINVNKRMNTIFFIDGNNTIND